MKILFVHQNFPGQYLHVARHLGSIPDNQVVFITQRKDATLPGVRNIVYQPHRPVTPNLHHYLLDTEVGLLNAQAVARAALDLKQSGFVPDVMIGHNGWGEIWYLKDVYPDVPLLGYFEFFYRLHGADVGFDPEEGGLFDNAPRIRTKNIGNLLALDAADAGQCATHWQKSLYPERYHKLLHVVHEGVDTQLVAPDQGATFEIPGTGITLSPQDEVVTYVARNLEPYRGFPSFMRSLPEILAARPHARVLIVGGDEASYGHRLPPGQTHRQRMVNELGNALDWSRVHFLGKLPYSSYLKVLQVSSCHVYLTYPFVLSWSAVEALSAGCLVVGSKTPPVEEAIKHGRNGLLVDFFAPQEISAQVIEVLANPADYAALRRNARKTAIDHYDLNTVCLPRQLELIANIARG